MSRIIRMIIFFAVYLVAIGKSLHYQRTTVDEDLSKIPGLDVFKGVELWKNNQNQCLADTFGSDTKQWTDVQTVKDMSFTAMCCLHSKKLIDFVQTAELRLKQLKGLTRVRFETVSDGDSAVKFFENESISSMRPVVLKMLATVLGFLKSYKVRVDKHFFNALTAFYLLLTVPIVTTNAFVGNAIRANVYVRNSVEAFTVRKCSSCTFDSGRNETAQEYDGWLSSVKFPKFLEFTRELVDRGNMLLTEVLEIELIAGEEHSRLKHMIAYWQYERVEIARVHDGLTNGYCCPEKITKFQTLVFECIGSVIFHLIKSTAQTDPADTQHVTAAINALEGFDFPGLVRVTLRTLRFKKMFRPLPGEEPWHAINMYFNESVFSRQDVAKLIVGADASAEEILNDFTNKLLAMKPYIENAVDINGYLCDYEYEEVGFLQHPPRNSEPYRITQEKSCVFSSGVITHLLLNDLIMSQCESTAHRPGTSAATKDHLPTCLRVLENSVKAIADNLNAYLNSTAQSAVFGTLTNRKVVHAVLAATLYFSDKTIFEDLHESDFGVLSSKLKTLKRYHLYIIGCMEQFAVVNSCPNAPPRAEIIAKTNDLVNAECTTVNTSKKSELVNCIQRTVIKIKRRYLDNGYPKIAENNFTIDKLLLDTIIVEKPKNTNNYLSLILDVSVYWEGEWRSLTEIRHFVTADIHPKYLCKYQLATIKSIIFILYEMMKTIIATGDTGENVAIYHSKIETMLVELRFISSVYFPYRINSVYEAIVRLFGEYFRDRDGIDGGALIKTIEWEQSYLEVKLHDNTKWTASSYGQTNVTKLLGFVKNYREAWKELNNVALLLHALKVADILIQ